MNDSERIAAGLSGLEPTPVTVPREPALRSSLELALQIEIIASHLESIRDYLSGAYHRNAVPPPSGMGYASHAGALASIQAVDQWLERLLRGDQFNTNRRVTTKGGSHEC